jgi:hypothetical protein
VQAESAEVVDEGGESEIGGAEDDPLADLRLDLEPQVNLVEVAGGRVEGRVGREGRSGEEEKNEGGSCGVSLGHDAQCNAVGTAAKSVIGEALDKADT